MLHDDLATLWLTLRMRRLGVRAVRRSELADRVASIAEQVDVVAAEVQAAPVEPADLVAEDGADAWGTDAPAAAVTVPTAGSKRQAAPPLSGRPQRQRRPRVKDDSSDTMSEDYSDEGRPRAKSRVRRDTSHAAREARAAVLQARVPRPPPSSSATLLRGFALADSLAAHPHLSLAAYNAAPTLPRKRLPHVIIRVSGGAPVAGAALAVSACSAPFAATRDAGPVAAVLGLADVYEHLRFAMAALRSARAEPPRAPVPLAVEGDPPSEAPALTELVYVADPPLAGEGEGVASGWAITRDRWEQRLHGGARR